MKKRNGRSQPAKRLQAVAGELDEASLGAGALGEVKASVEPEWLARLRPKISALSGRA